MSGAAPKNAAPHAAGATATIGRDHYAGGVVDDIMVVGVGGQGVIMAAAIIADTAMRHGGLDVKLSETRGMSQRGGSVSSHIRIGENVIAPSICPGEVDYLLAFESAEGMRLAPSLTKDGVAIVNTQQIVPPLASTGTHTYPFDAVRQMVDRGLRVAAIDGNALAEQVGDVRVAGVVLVGALSVFLPFAIETWERAIADNVPPSWLELNLAAFAAGRRIGSAGAGGTADAVTTADATGIPKGGAPGLTGTMSGAVRHDVYFERELETLEPGALRALQLERLKLVVARAYERSAVYTDLCRQASVSPDDIRSLDDRRRLPILDKATLRDVYPDGLRTCDLDDIIEVHSTSGTTGKPTTIWASGNDMDAWATRNARSMWMVGLRPGDLLQNCFAYGLATSIGLQYGAQRAGIGVVPAGIGRHELLIDLIVDLGVTAICTTPSYALFLADKARERGIDLARDSKLRVGLFGAEPWPESGRERLTAALGVEPFNEYGMGEFLGPGMACECGEKNGMHVWSDHLVVECVDPDTCEPVGDGETGELVWTSLTSDSMALIRYRSHDVSSLTWEPCACGRTHPRIGRITGRSDDALSIGGLVVFPSQIEEVLLRFAEIGNNFCLVVENVDNLDRLTLQVEIRELGEMTDEARERLAKKILAQTKTTVGVSPRVELHEPFSLPRMTGGQGKTACHRVDDRRCR